MRKLLILFSSILTPLATAVPAIAQSTRDVTQATGVGTELPNNPINNTTVDNVLANLFIVTGALSLIFIIVSGLRYTLSDGNEQKTAQAKEGLLYAIVGLVISLVAFAVVNFVVGVLI